MKIAEETGDPELKEQAKVNFGMANASMKWNNHINNILQGIQNQSKNLEENEDDDEDDNNEDS